MIIRPMNNISFGRCGSNFEPSNLLPSEAKTADDELLKTINKVKKMTDAEVSEFVKIKGKSIEEIAGEQFAIAVRNGFGRRF